MNKEEITNQLKSIVRPYARSEEALDNLNENTDFINDLKINSANLVDIILDLEEAFDITIDNESMQRMLDVKSALEIVESKLAEK
jgi:acyl carrier protein